MVSEDLPGPHAREDVLVAGSDLFMRAIALTLPAWQLLARVRRWGMRRAVPRWAPSAIVRVLPTADCAPDSSHDLQSVSQVALVRWQFGHLGSRVGSRGPPRSAPRPWRTGGGDAARAQVRSSRITRSAADFDTPPIPRLRRNRPAEQGQSLSSFGPEDDVPGCDDGMDRWARGAFSPAAAPSRRWSRRRRSDPRRAPAGSC